MPSRGYRSNSCAANVTVVNIDAGFKGGYVAGLIARNVARAGTSARRQQSTESRSESNHELALVLG